jgi:hypothetical protein
MVREREGGREGKCVVEQRRVTAEKQGKRER